MQYRYSAVVPCYNVGAACLPVIRGVAELVSSVVVVDDGSTDDTAAHLSTIKIANVSTVKHDTNRGKGAALVTGFRNLLESTNCDAVFTLDSDGQHDPAMIPSFQKLYETEQTDLIYGNRMVVMSGMPVHRRWLNAVSNQIVSRICHRPIADSQCGYRLYSRNLLQKVLDQLRSYRYELETEILILACLQNFKVSSIPISMIYSKEAMQLSHHSLPDVLRITRLLIRHF